MSILVEVPYVVNPVTGVRTLLGTARPRRSGNEDIVMLPNDAFSGVFEFTGSLVGNGNRFEVRDTVTGTFYNIFPSDVARYIVAGHIAYGGSGLGNSISGRWHVIRRNTAYGVALV